MRQSSIIRKHNSPSEYSFKKMLADFGYSADIADRILKWYTHRIRAQQLNVPLSNVRRKAY
jgi:hypothetical protein